MERGSGNVFADIDFPDADAHLSKAEFVSRIDAIARWRVQRPHRSGAMAKTSDRPGRFTVRTDRARIAA